MLDNCKKEEIYFSVFYKRIQTYVYTLRKKRMYSVTYIKQRYVFKNFCSYFSNFFLNIKNSELFILLHTVKNIFGEILNCLVISFLDLLLLVTLFVMFT